MDNSQPGETEVQEKSFLKVIVHSFFIIPFLIAVFCLLLFAGINLLTQEKRDVYDYLKDVKTGGLDKRWQGAFELSKILSNPKLLPKDTRFSQELISAFEHSRHDDNRVRQYLALAMGRTGRPEFVDPLIKGLAEEKEENIWSLIYGLGMLRDSRGIDALSKYLEHPDARIRSITVVSLGNIGDTQVKRLLRPKLSDQEANVQWGAAVSLAKLGDPSGKEIILKLLDRQYISQFEEVDVNEADQLILSAIDASKTIKDNAIIEQLKKLSTTDPNMNIRASALDALQ